MLDKQALEAQLFLLKRPSVGWLYGRRVRIDMIGKTGRMGFVDEETGLPVEEQVENKKDKEEKNT
jgi:hypothetical protein